MRDAHTLGGVYLAMTLARDRIDFTLRELEILHALIATGTTIAASQRLGISQFAVSRSLTQLEGGLRRTFFERQAGRRPPTPDALAINGELGPVLASLARIAKRASSQHDDYRGRLRIGARPTIAHRFRPTLGCRTSFRLPSSRPTSASAAGFMDFARSTLENRALPTQTN